MQNRDRSELSRLRKKLRGLKRAAVDPDPNEIASVEAQVASLAARDREAKVHHAMVDLVRALKRGKEIEVQKLISIVKKRRMLAERARDKVNAAVETARPKLEKQRRKQERRMLSSEADLEAAKKWDPQARTLTTQLIEGNGEVEFDALQKQWLGHRVVVEALRKLKELDGGDGVPSTGAGSGAGSGTPAGEWPETAKKVKERKKKPVSMPIPVPTAKRHKPPQPQPQSQSQSQPQSQPASAPESHPSWEAKRRAREEQKAKFAGSRVVFGGDSDSDSD